MMQSRSSAESSACLSAMREASSARSETMSVESMLPSSPLSRTSRMKAVLSGASASLSSIR